MFSTRFVAVLAHLDTLYAPTTLGRVKHAQKRAIVTKEAVKGPGED